MTTTMIMQQPSITPSRFSLSGRAASAALALSLAAGVATADLPAALDRVPDSALVTISSGNLEALIADADILQGGLGIAGSGDGLAMAKSLLETDGIDRDGSVAVALMPAAGGGDPTPIIIAPVDNFDAFVNSFDARTEGGISTFEFFGETAHAKPIGGGYAAMTTSDELISGFAGEGGMMAKHEALAGPTGARVAAASDAVVLANIQLLKPQLEEGYEQFKGQMGMMAMMAGPQAADLEGQIEALDVIAQGFLRDAQIGILGLDASDAGLSIDLASQFSEGSEIAGFFQAAGDSASLLTRVPDMQFLLAGAGDFSAPGIQTLMERANELNAKMQPEGNAFDMTEMWTSSDGIAGVMGASPALFAGGLFSNSVLYMHADDPAKAKASMVELYKQMDGQTVEGMTYSTKYDSGSVEIAGETVDTWTMAMKVDPAHPQAMMMQQSMMMMLGPQMGFSGYSAATESGYVTTYAQNTNLMTSALSAANGDGGLGANEAIARVAKHLPDNRTAEVFLGTKTMTDYAKMAMAMMGGGAQLDVPDDLDPVGIGIATDEGGFRARTFISQDVLRTIASLQQQGGGNQGGGGGNNAPRF